MRTQPSTTPQRAHPAHEMYAQGPARVHREFTGVSSPIAVASPTLCRCIFHPRVHHPLATNRDSMAAAQPATLVHTQYAAPLYPTQHAQSTRHHSQRAHERFASHASARRARSRTHAHARRQTQRGRTNAAVRHTKDSRPLPAHALSAPSRGAASSSRPVLTFCPTRWAPAQRRWPWARRWPWPHPPFACSCRTPWRRHHRRCRQSATCPSVRSSR